MEFCDYVIFERGKEVRLINIKGLVEILEENEIRVDPYVSEKIVSYNLEFDPDNWVSRESFLPLKADIPNLDVISYLFRGYSGADTKFEIELKNVPRGDTRVSRNVPSFGIKVESSNRGFGYSVMEKIYKSVEQFCKFW